MVMSDRSQEAWRKAFAEALGVLSETVTAHRRGLPNLGNVEYRELARRARADVNARAMLDEYLTEIAADPSDVIELVMKHPAVGAVFGERGKDAATFVTMPGKGFRVELKQLARRAATIGASRGDEAAAVEVDRFLTLGIEGRLPGYDVVVIRGLAMDGVVELGPGAGLASYEDAVERGLLKKEKPAPWNDVTDYRDMQAMVLFRKMTWNPCLVPPRTSKDLNEPPLRVEFAWKTGPAMDVLLDLLSLVTSQRIEVVEMLSCAPDFVDMDPNFGPGTKRWFVSTDRWEVRELTSEQVTQARRLFCEWMRFDKGERGVLELALARLVSSTRRNRGRFRLEDRILDVAVALEMMFRLKGGELTYKLSVRAAYLLSDGLEARVEVFDSMKRLYETRSRIVHGDWHRKSGKRKEAAQVAERGYELGRDVLLKLLERGTFPDWKRLVLSAE